MAAAVTANTQPAANKVVYVNLSLTANDTSKCVSPTFAMV